MKTQTLKWFININNIQDLKTKFKTLILAWHPDRNTSPDALENSKSIISEYNYLLKSQNFSNVDYDINDEILKNENYINLINELTKIDNITIELIGAWLWISGNTYANKDKLKSLGCLFASNKKMWFYRDEEYKKSSGGASLDIEQIKSKYGVKATFSGSANNLKAIA